MGQNFDIFDLKIADEDMKYIDSLDCNRRSFDFGPYKESPDFPFNIEFWKGIFREEFLVWRLASLV